MGGDLPQCPHLIWLKRRLCMDFGMYVSVVCVLLLEEFSFMFFTPAWCWLTHAIGVSCQFVCELVCVLSVESI